MKTNRLIGGLILSGAIVSAGSLGLGITSKKIETEKQEKAELIQKIKRTKISDSDFSKIKTQAEQKNIPYEINKTYKKALDSLNLKASYEKVYLQTIDSLKRVIAQKDDSIKILTKATK